MNKYIRGSCAKEKTEQPSNLFHGFLHGFPWVLRSQLSQPPTLLRRLIGSTSNFCEQGFQLRRSSHHHTMDPTYNFFRILHLLCPSSAFEKQPNTANTSNLPIVIQVQHSPTLIKEPSKRVSCGTSRQARGSGGTRIPSDWGNDDLQPLGFGMSRSSAGQW
jgi:hypothetical protein